MNATYRTRRIELRELQIHETYVSEGQRFSGRILKEGNDIVGIVRRKFLIFRTKHLGY